MILNKSNITEALKHVFLKEKNTDLVSSGQIKNIQVFDTEVVLDIEIHNPSLIYKKNLEVECLKIIHKHVYEKAIVKVNFIVKAKEEAPKIRGNKIPGIKNIIAVASGKGGVGKSTITSNLAIGLVSKGYKVGLLDADIYGPSIHIMFDVENEKPKGTNDKGEKKILPIESFGVKLLSIGFFSETQKAVVWRGPMASKALNQMLWNTEWGELDYLLIDLPPGTGDIHLSLVQSIPLTASIIVTTPQKIALADARKGIAMFQMDSISVPVLGVVENMSYFSPKELPENKYFIFGKDGAQNLCKKLNIPLLAEVPLVQSVREASDIGRPAILQGATEVGLCFEKLTNNFILEQEKLNKKGITTKKVEITNMNGCSS